MASRDALKRAFSSPNVVHSLNLNLHRFSIPFLAHHTLLHLVRLAGRDATLLKRDLKDAFRMVPVAPHERWLLGFSWAGQYYVENCLPFGLRTALFHL